MKTQTLAPFYCGDSGELMRHISRFYFRQGDKIADVTFGEGVFWKRVDVSQYDIHASDLWTCPDASHDLRQLPYPDGSFDVAVIDPPQCHHPATLLINDNYRNRETTDGMSHDDLMELYRQGMTAATLMGIAIVASIAVLLINQARMNESQALAKESEARANAEMLAQRNQTVVNNFVAAFRSTDPENKGVTSKMTALEVLQQALTQIQEDGELSKDDLTKATLLHAIGKSLGSLGAHAQAVTAAEETLRLRNTQLGGEHADTLTSMNDLAAAYYAAGRLEEAVPLFEATLRLRKAKLGDEDPDTLNSMNNLANAYESAGRLDEALPLYEETLRLRKAKLGDEHPDTLNSMNNLACVYLSAGRLDEALPLYEKTLRLFGSRLGDEHPKTFTIMNNLANAYAKADRLDEALPLYEETLRLRKAKLGDEHPATLASMNDLAVAYQAAGRLDEALPLYEETFRLRKARMGEQHPDTLGSMNNLASGYCEANRPSEALPLYEATLRIMKVKLGSEHPITLHTMRGYQEALLKFKQFGVAMDIAADWVRIFQGVATSEHSQFARANVSLAESFLGMGKLTDARLAVNEALATDELDNLQHNRADSVKGAILASDANWEEAESLLIDSATSFMNQLSQLKISQRWYVPRACERVIAMYEAWGKPEEAAKWKTKLAAVNAEIERLRNQHAPAKDGKDRNAVAKSAVDSTPDKSGENDRSENEPE